MMIKKWNGKSKLRVLIVREELKMGVSMAILQTLEGRVAKKFLKESEEAKISKETIKKCFDLVKDIKIK